MGFHPNAEDGGLYTAEIKRVLNPAMYPHGAEFVSGHLGLSAFATTMAWLVRHTRLDLSVVLFGVHGGSVAAALAGVSWLAQRCYRDAPSRWGAVGLFAVCVTIPVAGTSLLLMDPYVTARSLSTSLTLLGMAALLAMLEQPRIQWVRLAAVVTAFGVAFAFHPLMAAYGVMAAVLLALGADRRHFIGMIAVGIVAVLAAWVAQTMEPSGSPDYLRVADTRFYWFISRWQWYEVLGLAAPLAILTWFGWIRPAFPQEARLARMAVASGGIATLVALLFAWADRGVVAVARMQPLRCFQMVYAVMLMVLGAALGRLLGRSSAWRWIASTAVLGGSMLFVQRQTYPNSDHLEFPWKMPQNQWEQAFLWVNRNTPEDALFALDADYIHTPGEDAQCFRAIAERSALPDYSKDGGQASIRPELTPAWVIGQRAQAELTREGDATRMERLKGLGVSWVLLGRNGETGWNCPFVNGAVRVCRTPERDDE